MTEQFDTKTAEIRSIFNIPLEPKRTADTGPASCFSVV
jgi:hypothetical protein